MTTSIDQANLTRSHQLSAVRVLIELLHVRDLPTARWLIPDHDTDPLDGQLTSTYSQSPDVAAARLKQWADFLGAQPTARAYTVDNGYGCIQAEAVWHGMRVRVWDGLLLNDIPSAWLVQEADDE